MRPKSPLLIGLGAFLTAIVTLVLLHPGLSFAASTNTLTANVNVGNAIYISIPTNTNTFGNVYSATSYYTNVPITVDDPGGNLAANILVSGGNWVSGSNSFGVGNTLFDYPSQPSSYTGTALTGTLTDTNVVIAQPTFNSISPSNSVFFGVFIPEGTPPGLYTQALTFENKNSASSINSITALATLTANVQGTCYISLSPNAISFGSIAPTANVPTNVLVTDKDTGGNVAASVFVEGTVWTGPTSFGVSNTLWDASSNSLYTGTPLTSSLATTPITIAAPSQNTPSTSNSIYFGLGIPAGTSAGTYNQIITLENSC